MKLNKLKTFIKMTEEQVLRTVEKHLSKVGYGIYTNLHRDFILAVPREGELNPVLLVAHADTVYSKPPKEVFHDKSANVLWSPQGLGADDRAGVWAIVELAKRYNVAVLVTTGEESGGTGARAFTASYPENVFGFKVALQLDRCNSNDCVFYRNDNIEFHNYIQDFGFKKAYGSFSDISVIGPEWKLNTANLSVGFVNEHTSKEHLYVDALLSTISKVGEIIQSDIPEFEYMEYDYSYAKTYQNVRWTDRDGITRSGWYSDEELDYYKDYYGEDKVKQLEISDSKTYDELYSEGYADCVYCGEFHKEEDLVFINNYIDICDECFETKGFYCGYCGEPELVELQDSSQAANLQICDSCYHDIYLADVKYTRK